MSRKCHIIIVLACAFVATPQTGCATKTGTAAVVGGAAGAGLGAVIGHQSGHAGGGALIGGAAGAIGGGLVGNSMDKADERKAREQRERDQAAARQQATYNKPSTPPPPPTATPTSTITRGDVVDWTRQGVRDEIIIDRIQRSGQQFVMTSADERELKSLGVSTTVINAMKATSAS